MKHTVVRKNLNNGTKALIVSVPGAETFECIGLVRAGFGFAENDAYELPHLLEHVMCDGNAAFPTLELFGDAMESRGIYHNASTGRNYMEFIFSGSKQQGILMCDTLATQVTRPVLNEEDVIHEKETIANELGRYAADSGRLLGYNLDLLRYPGLYPSYELRAEMVKNAIFGDDVRNYHARFFVQKNIRFFLVGDFEDESFLQNCLSVIQGKMDALEVGVEFPIPQRSISRLQEIIVRQSIEPNISQFEICFSIDGYRKEYRAAIRVLAAMLGTGTRSRLFAARKAGLTYGTDVDWGFGPNVSHVSVYGKTHPEKTLGLMEFCFKELYEMSIGKFEDSEMERAKGYLVGRFPFSQQTAISTGEWYLNDLRYDMEISETSDWFLEWTKSITRDDIMNAAKFFLTRKLLHVSVLDHDFEIKKGEYEKLMNTYFPL